MRKLLLLLALLVAFPVSGFCQGSTAEDIVLGILTTTSSSPVYPIWSPISTTNQLPIAVYDAGNNTGFCYTSNGSASPATFQACSGGGGGGSIAFKATTSNVTYYPVFALGATNTATTAYVDTSNPWQYNASTGLTGILGITTTSLTDNGDASLNGTTTIATAQIAAGNAVFTNLTGTTISGTNASLSGTITAGSLQVTGNANLAGTTTISTAQILAGNAIFTTVTGTTGNLTNVLSTTITGTTINFTNALGTTITATNIEGIGNAKLAGTTTVNNISITGTCTGCTATPAAGSIYNIQYNNGSNAFAANAGLNVSTTRAGLDFLSNVTTANLLSLGNNGADVTSYALGESALLAQSTTNLDNTAIGGFALTAVTTGLKNTGIGWDAGQIITVGTNNTVIGALVASTTLTTGTNNILIGVDNTVDTAATNTSSTLNIGNLLGGVLTNATHASKYPLTLTATGSGVQGFVMQNTPTGQAPILTVAGSDTNGTGLGMAINGLTATATGIGGPISLTAGNAFGSGAGGAISLTGGNSAGSNSGGAINLLAGGSPGNGGAVNITAGTPGSGGTSGTVTITSGTLNNSVPGSVVIKGADASSQANINGSAVTITGGNSTSGGGTSTAGAVSITAGAGGASATTDTTLGGIASLVGGAGGTTNNAGGVAKVVGGAGAGSRAGGAAQLTGGAGGATGTGGTATITSGAGGATSGNSGNITLAIGSTTSGSKGIVNITGSSLNITSTSVIDLPDGHIDGTSIAVGANALAAQSATGSNNAAVGYQALTAVTTGINNVGVGKGAGALITTGTGNTLLGYNAGSTVLTVGSNNILIGQGAAATTSADINTINIGGIYLATGIGTASTSTPTIHGVPVMPDLTTDATHTDDTLCWDTTSKTVYFGSGTAGICLGSSSIRYKEKVIQLADGLPQIENLKPVNFYYKKGHGDNGAKRQYGFLAEDMKAVLPGLVGLDKDGNPNSVDLVGIIPVLVNGMQQQQKEIDDLKKQLAKKK